MTFQDAITAIWATTYDQLLDALDYIDLTIINKDNPDYVKRSGLPSPFDGVDVRSASEYAQHCAEYRKRKAPHEQAAYMEAVVQVITALQALGRGERDTLYRIGRLRQQDIAPIANRKPAGDTGKSVAKGFIRIKTIGNQAYLYYAWSVTGGDRDRKKKRLKSTYVGRSDLADWIQTHLPYSDVSARKLRKAALHHLRDLYNDDNLTNDFDVEALEAFVEDQRSSGDKS